MNARFADRSAIGCAGDVMKNLLSLLLLSTSLFVGTSVAQLVIVTPPQVVLAKGQKMQLQAYLY
jgi:hypothetical protein